MDERIANLEDRMNSIQCSLDVLPDILTRCLQQHFDQLNIGGSAAASVRPRTHLPPGSGGGGGSAAGSQQQLHPQIQNNPVQPPPPPAQQHNPAPPYAEVDFLAGNNGKSFIHWALSLIDTVIYRIDET